ncbi:glycosyltransferase [Escherichia albertii]|uniref:Predicted glycosyltransferase family 2 n=1 Tax=Escherichia albertii TaxID=208962 RepID=A0A5A4U8G5_ESCAL|nr:glycosyltransferase [Escherichia albertii]MCZ9168621.1 glycosyltransferase [Escherichia albertii]BBM62842.1 predicted glycosyltransferase family 2 [Escherichia albertii]
MKFSVLLSLYTKEKPEYLHDCLESIRLNTLQPDQVIIVFDGPISVELQRVVSNFMAFLCIDIVKLPENVGLGTALNYGLTKCRNEIVLRMDTDDVCALDRFAVQIDFLMTHETVAVLGGAINEFDEKMECSRGVRYTVSEHKDILQYAKRRNPFNHMTVAFRKTVVESVGGYKHHHLMEDYNLWLRILAAGYETYNMNKIFVNVRAGDNMLTRRKGKGYIKSEIQLAKLKCNLKIDSSFSSFFWAVLRIIPRILPTQLLKVIYKKLRQ